MVFLTLVAMDGPSGDWQSFFKVVAMAGGFMLWKEAEKVGSPRAQTITAKDIRSDEELAEAVATIHDYVERREANSKDEPRA